MNMTRNIKDLFYPGFYAKSLHTANPNELCLLKNKGLGRYCLAVFSYAPDTPIKDQIKIARRKVAGLTKALWFFREVGVYLVFDATSHNPDISEQDLSVDLTGLHAVIIQGVHVIGANNTHVYKHSKWLSHAFGGSEKIADTLLSITSAHDAGDVNAA